MSLPASSGKFSLIRKYSVFVFILILLCIVVWFLFIEQPAVSQPQTTQNTETSTKSITTENSTIKQAEAKVISWNLYNFGKSKDDVEIAFIAEVIKGFDVVTIQEISTGPEGPQAVARLADALSRTGFAWDYVVSDPTTGDGTERYAYMWKPSRIKIMNRPWLSKELAPIVDREPYLARFNLNGKTLLLASFHAIPTSKDPEIENGELYRIHDNYKDDNLLIMGDFNQSQSHQVFNTLKTRDYKALLKNQKTSIKRKVVNGEKLVEEYDNIFYELKAFDIKAGGIINITDSFRTLRQVRKISDHLPVWAEIRIKN